MILISKNRFQKWSLFFGFGSWLFFLIANSRDFIIKYILGEEIPHPNYAPHNFSYNVEIVFPAILGVFVFGLICLGFCIAYLRTQKDDTLSQKLIPFIGVVPSMYLIYLLIRFFIPVS